jgi:Mg-chelatase subunit ChlD
VIAFTTTTDHNEALPIGGNRVDAIVTVAATGAGPRTAAADGAAVMLVLDGSGSMRPRAKWNALKKAARAAISQIRDGVAFGVIIGCEEAHVIYPRTSGLAKASNATRAEAIAAVENERADGGTAIGRWLLEACERLAPYERSVRHAILLTDGQDQHETPEEFRAALRSCEGVFQCDCRGVGTDWRVDELRSIASALLGTVDLVARPDDMAADFEAMMRGAMGKRTADVRLRLWRPSGATVNFVKQVSPTIEDLTTRGVAIAERTVDFPTGAWGDEVREYHIAIGVPPQQVGEKMAAARVSLVVDDQPVSQSLIEATWTDDRAASTRLNQRVAHYTGQAELADAIAEGLDARAIGDTATASVRFGRAAQLAEASGNTGTLRLLKGVVEIVDAPTGTVRLRRNASAEDEMALDARSTRTVRIAND